MNKMKVAVTVWGMIGLVSTSFAQSGSNPSGTWKWERTGRNGETRTSTLVLKLDGDKLTGVMSGRNGNQVEIQDATFKDDEIKFKITRQFNDREFTRHYVGKLEGNTIKGVITFQRRGEEVEREWLATRSVTADGTWTWDVTGRNGRTWTSTLKLKQEDGQLTGVMLGRNGDEIPIDDASIKDDALSFKVTRQFGDREFTMSFSGRLKADEINGTISFDRQGETVEREWNAKRE